MKDRIADTKYNKSNLALYWLKTWLQINSFKLFVGIYLERIYLESEIYL